MSKTNYIFPLIFVVLVVGTIYSMNQPAQNSVDNKLLVTPTKAMSKLIIVDQLVGTGKEVKSGDIISIHYLGTLENGTKFDSSYDRKSPFETQIGVGQVIKGWDEGVVGMKVGGKRKLTIPSDMAYGEQGAGGVIPPNATLIFEVELIAIK